MKEEKTRRCIFLLEMKNLKIFVQPLPVASDIVYHSGLALNDHTINVHSQSQKTSNILNIGCEKIL